jgi:hypothetical protein
MNAKNLVRHPIEWLTPTTYALLRRGCEVKGVVSQKKSAPRALPRPCSMSASNPGESSGGESVASVPRMSLAHLVQFWCQPGKGKSRISRVCGILSRTHRRNRAIAGTKLHVHRLM